jgi:FAD/FMN-containing dehydrogenase
MWLATRCGTIPWVNALRCRSGMKKAWDSPYLESHAGFHFLLDYVPRWHWAFRPGGLIQFQPFIPKESASRVLRTLIESCQRKGIIPYLGVLKRHRPDPFLMTHAVDGYSLAMDFAVPTNQKKRVTLWQHCQEMAELVFNAGGRFYYAKDAILWSDCLARVHGEETLERFLELKQELDPLGIMQTDLWRRLRSNEAREGPEAML